MPTHGEHTVALAALGLAGVGFPPLAALVVGCTTVPVAWCWCWSCQQPEQRPQKRPAEQPPTEPDLSLLPHAPADPTPPVLARPAAALMALDQPSCCPVPQGSSSSSRCNPLLPPWAGAQRPAATSYCVVASLAYCSSFPCPAALLRRTAGKWGLWQMGPPHTWQRNC